MANVDFGQILTVANSLPPAAPVIIQAGTLLALIQAAGQPSITWYDPTGAPAPVDLTAFPGV